MTERDLVIEALTRELEIAQRMIAAAALAAGGELRIPARVFERMPLRPTIERYADFATSETVIRVVG